MRARIANVWEEVSSGLWFIPGLLMALAVVLGFVLPVIDRNVELRAASELLFGGTADAARSLVSAIAAATITVVAVSFSVTIVAIQQSATQYTPRVLGGFMRNRGNQVVLGAYLATFTYSLLVLRQIRDDTPQQEAVVPGLSITMAVLFALVSIALFIFFMQHISQQLQSSTILQSITKDTLRVVRKIFPEEFGVEAGLGMDEAAIRANARALGGAHEEHIRATGSGYVRRIDEGQLITAGREAAFVHIPHAIGEFIVPGARLLTVWSREPLDEQTKSLLQGAFVLGAHRTLVQDPLFGIQQMTDIAVKALSPGINDPSTAAQSMDHLAAILAVLAGKQFPEPFRRGENDVYYLFTVPSFRDYMHAAFNDIHHFARNNPTSLAQLIRSLEDIGEQVPSVTRAAAVRGVLERIIDGLPTAAFSASDKDALEQQATAVLGELDFKPVVDQPEIRRAS